MICEACKYPHDPAACRYPGTCTCQHRRREEDAA